MASLLQQCLGEFARIVLALDADGVVLDSNGEWERRTGRDAVGRPFAELVDPSSAAKVGRMFSAPLAGHSARLAPNAWELVVPEGDTIEVRTFVLVRGRRARGQWLVESPANPREEALLGELSAVSAELSTMHRDLVKERSRLEHSLRRAEELHQQAERAVRMRDDVLAIVAHDLRNPVSRIRMAASMLRDATLPDDQRIRLAEVAERSAAHVERLIGDLLDVAAIESGSLTIEPAEMSVPALLEDVRDQFAEQAALRQLSVTCEAEPFTMQADRVRVQQVLGNLVGNAVRLTPAGGCVTLRACARDDVVTYSVQDTGPGIPEEELPYLFQRYWQARRSNRGSAGLGLAIAKGIVEAHGGSIQVESTVGEGSTFRFSLPRTR